MSVTNHHTRPAVILQQLGVHSTDDALVKLLEATGALVLCIHWLRGTFNWMMHTGAVQFPSEEDKANYERLFQTIELYEKIIWEIVPSRAALVGMRDLRLGGGNITLDELETLFIQDKHGRIPFDATDEEIADIEDLLRRLGEARIAREQGATHDKATKRAYATMIQQGVEK